MANTCFSNYKVVGKREDVNSLYETLKKMQDNKEPIVPNGWHYANMWLGCLVAALGGDSEKVYCRGHIDSFSLVDNDEVLSIDTETAWCEMDEVRHFIESRFEDMKIYYIEEECGEDIYNTNDAEGRFFKDRFFIDSYGDIPNDGYFLTIEEAAKAVSEVVGYEVEATKEAIITSLDDYEEAHEDKWYSFHEYQVLDD